MDKPENPAEVTVTNAPYDVIRPHELTNYALMELKTLLEKAAFELGRDWSQRLRDRIVVSVDRVASRHWKDVRAWIAPSEPPQKQTWFPLSFQSDALGRRMRLSFPPQCCRPCLTA
ncbi:MAG: hypothetical protein IKS45_06010 [Thermoguttaceae bacterium]|nr:hypothetical protein [Thermoguttaceae bacterium]